MRALALALVASLSLASLVSSVTSVARAADDDKKNGVTSSITVGVARSRIYSVRHDYFDVRLGIGGTFGDGSVALDWLGTLSVSRGNTEAGRTTTGFGFLGTTAILRYKFLRVGAGVELAVLTIDRSTGGADSDAYARAELLLGAELVRSRDFNLFVDGRAHTASWGGAPANGLSLAVGVRF